jgi:hypothetical protein
MIGERERRSTFPSGSLSSLVLTLSIVCLAGRRKEKQERENSH